MIPFLFGAPQPFVLFGILVAWVYLRFYQREKAGGTVGDMSPEFSFASFFPEPVQYVP